MIDNTELDSIMAILEKMDDELLSVQLLKEFNEKTSALGKLLINYDGNLKDEEWKSHCDQAKKDVDEIVWRINQFK